MKKHTKQLLSTVAAAAVVVSAVPAYASAAEATVTNGLYINAGETKYYFTTDELFGGEKADQIADLINQAGPENVFLVQDGEFVSVNGIFEGNGFAPITDDSIPAGEYVGTDGEKVSVGTPVAPELKVESVSAINPTTIKVTFNNELTEVAAENFAIAGVEVTEVVLADNKKDVLVTVSPGFKYDTSYEVNVTGLTEEPLSTTFTSLAVTDIWDLQIEAPESLKGDGVDTEVITFKLVDKETGEIDTNANDVVLDVNSTYGYLSQKRVTMQNGKAEVILRSEFQEGGVTAKVEAQVIEAKAGSIYKELIGKVVANPVNVKFTVGGGNGGGEQLLLKSLKSANTNEADRVVLTFDEEIEAKELYNVATGADLGNVTVFQQSGTTVHERKVAGYAINPNNKKSVTVYLKKGLGTGVADQEFLADNQDVYVTAKIGQASAQTVSFKFADARTPNLASVKPVVLPNGTTSNKQIVVAFTEPVLKTNFGIDGRFDSTHFDVVYGDVTWDNTAKKFVDKRNEAVLTLNAQYQEPDLDSNNDYIYPAGFFKPGKHDLEASSIFDFAAETDSNNVGTTQNLTFEIAVNPSLVQPEVTVDSPEQFRVGFNMDYAILDAAGAISDFADEVQFQVLKKATVAGQEDEWITLGANDGKFASYFPNAKKADGTSINGFADFLEITQLDDGSYKIETTTDWTYIYDTATTKDNYYNDEFRLVLPENQVVTAANGKKNAEEIVLPLTKATNSPLAKPDTKSPEIVDGSIKKVDGFHATSNPKFDVSLTEPVKIFAGDEAGKTLAQGQTELPEPKVEFIGKDKNGKTRTFIGSVEGYKGAVNKEIIVKWNTKDQNNKPIETPQDIVDAGGSTEWTLVIKSVSDDVGNTAPTATGTFNLDPTSVVAPSTEFKVAPTGGAAIGDGTSASQGFTNRFAVTGLEGDSIEITFTEAVAVTGLGSATNVKNYALNGKDLPAGTSIALAKDAAGDIVDNKVVIKLSPGTLKPTNVITLTKNLVSKKGIKISQDLSFTFKLITQAEIDAENALQAAKTTLSNAITAAQTQHDDAVEGSNHGEYPAPAKAD